MDVALPGLFLEPGDRARVEVTIDVDASAPAGFLELVVPRATSSTLTTRTRTRAPRWPPSPAISWPLYSGLGHLVSPSRELAVGLDQRMPAVSRPTGAAVPAGRLTLRNADTQGSGPIELDHLVCRDATAASPRSPWGGRDPYRGLVPGHPVGGERDLDAGLDDRPPAGAAAAARSSPASHGRHRAPPGHTHRGHHREPGPGRRPRRASA